MHVDKFFVVVVVFYDIYMIWQMRFKTIRHH